MAFIFTYSPAGQGGLTEHVGHMGCTERHSGGSDGH